MRAAANVGTAFFGPRLDSSGLWSITRVVSTIIQVLVKHWKAAWH